MTATINILRLNHLLTTFREGEHDQNRKQHSRAK